MGVGRGRARRMAATGTPRRAVRTARAREEGSAWTPAQPPLGLGARADPGPEVTALSQLDETSPRPDNDGLRPKQARKVSEAPVDEGWTVSRSSGGWSSFYQDLDVGR